MKRFSIRLYVSWLTLTPLLIITVSLESFFLHGNFSELDQNLMERGHLIASQLASSSEYGVFANNQSFLQNLAQGALQQPDVRGVIILNAASDVSIEAGEFFGAPKNATGDVNTAISRLGNIKDSVNLQMPIYRSSEGLRIYHPINPAQIALDELDNRPEVKQIGSVILEMSSARTEQLKSQVLWLTVGSTALFLIFPFGLIYLGSRSITTPIRKLSDAMQALGEGHFETRVAVSAPVTELANLTYGINDMAAKLQQEQSMLQQRTARLTEAQRLAHLGNWEWDIANNTLLWSDEIYRIFGLTPQQFGVTYDAFIQAVHPDDRQLVDGKVREALEQGRSYSIGHRILLPDGAVRFVHEQAEVSRNKDGQALKMLGTVQDITEHKLAEEAIRKQQELTTQIIETIPMRVFWKDRDSRYLGCNTLFAKDAGLIRPDQLIGKTDFDMGWKDQAEIYRADDRLVMDSNTPKLSYDEPQTTPEGGHIWLRTSKVPLRNEINEAIGVLGVYEDITKYKQMELKLRESEERFRMAFQNSAIGMALAGLDGHWLKVNNTLCQIVGYSEQELLGKTFQDITHPDDLQSDVNFMKRQLAGEIEHFQKEKRYIHKDGHVVWIRLSVSLIRDAQDKPIHFVAQMDDITENKLIEEKIRRMNEELETKVQQRTQQLLDAQEELVRKEKLAVLGQVAGSVGHELRNPLGVMNNAVYFLQTVLANADETTKEYLNIIKSEIASSERIVSDLLDAVRTKPPHSETVSIAELIGQTLRKCNVPPSVSVKLDIPATLPPLRVDAMQIHQVFRNLISNGVEAMPDGGVLEIGAVENMPDGTVAVSVRDNGSGIAPEALKNLFQPLFTTKARGIGLGLVVVKNLTEANGGTVAVQSKIGHGTTFIVTLPLVGASGSIHPVISGVQP